MNTSQQQRREKLHIYNSISTSAITRRSIFTGFAYRHAASIYKVLHIFQAGFGHIIPSKRGQPVPRDKYFFLYRTSSYQYICLHQPGSSSLGCIYCIHDKYHISIKAALTIREQAQSPTPRGKYDRYSPRDGPRPRHRLEMLTIADKPMNIGTSMLFV